eukprot:scaffold40973_cov50-Attheya_sp.AAC.1
MRIADNENSRAFRMLATYSQEIDEAGLYLGEELFTVFENEEHHAYCFNEEDDEEHRDFGHLCDSVEGIGTSTIHANCKVNLVVDCTYYENIQQKPPGIEVVSKESRSNKRWSANETIRRFLRLLLGHKGFHANNHNDAGSVARTVSSCDSDDITIHSLDSASFIDGEEQKGYEILFVEKVQINDDDPWTAAKRGDFDALVRFMNHDSSEGIIDWTREDDFGNVPLYYACHTGASAGKSGLKSVEMLIDLWPGSLPKDIFDRCKKNAINLKVADLLDRSLHRAHEVKYEKLDWMSLSSCNSISSDEESTSSGEFEGMASFFGDDECQGDY